MDKFRAGLLYYSAGQRVIVEAGFSPIGHTSLCPKTGQQVYWFKSLAEFERYKKDIFENTAGIHRPVPLFEPIGETVAVEAVEVEAVVPPPPPAPPAPEEAPSNNDISQIKDRVFQAHANRTIRIKDFAAELGIDAETLKTIIESDSRYAPLAAGWVRRAESQI